MACTQARPYPWASTKRVAVIFRHRPIVVVWWEGCRSDGLHAHMHTKPSAFCAAVCACVQGADHAPCLGAPSCDTIVESRCFKSSSCGRCSVSMTVCLTCVCTTGVISHAHTMKEFYTAAWIRDAFCGACVPLSTLRRAGLVLGTVHR